MLDKHIELVTAKDVAAPGTRQTPFPFNEDLRDVIHHSKELLEAVDELIGCGPPVSPAQEQLYLHYSQRLVGRLDSLQRVRTQIENADELRGIYATEDRGAAANRIVKLQIDARQLRRLSQRSNTDKDNLHVAKRRTNGGNPHPVVVVPQQQHTVCGTNSRTTYSKSREIRFSPRQKTGTRRNPPRGKQRKRAFEDLSEEEG